MGPVTVSRAQDGSEFRGQIPTGFRPQKTGHRNIPTGFRPDSPHKSEYSDQDSDPQGVPFRVSVSLETEPGTPRNRNRNPHPLVSGLKPHPCRRCLTEVITGFDAPRAALLATCDPAPIGILGEVLALQDGRRTYDLVAGKILRRLDWHIRSMPASTRHPTLAEHRCGQPLPDTWLAPPAPATQPRDTLEVPF